MIEKIALDPWNNPVELGVEIIMRRRWSVILPIYGLALFGWITLVSIRAQRQTDMRSDARYFWWGAERLDSDPLNKRPHPRRVDPCDNGEPGCFTWNPEEIWVEPGICQKALVITAIPAVLSTILVVSGFSRLGVSQIVTFMISAPLLIFAWFYFLGWLIDRRRYKRLLKSAQAS